MPTSPCLLSPHCRSVASACCIRIPRWPGIPLTTLPSICTGQYIPLWRSRPQSSNSLYFCRCFGRIVFSYGWLDPCRFSLPPSLRRELPWLIQLKADAEPANCRTVPSSDTASLSLGLGVFPAPDKPPTQPHGSRQSSSRWSQPRLIVTDQYTAAPGVMVTLRR